MQKTFHALSCKEEFIHFNAEKSACTWEILWLVHGISLTVFYPMVLVRGIASKRIEPKYWVCGIVSQWFWSMVLSEA